MRLADLKTYWENAAKNNLAIQHTESEKHFCVFTAEDALSSLKQLEDNVLVLELPNSTLSDANSDNIRYIPAAAVLILKSANQGNKDEVIQAYLDLEPVAIQLISKMLNDRKKANNDNISAPEKYMKHLDLNRIRMVDVGPVFDDKYGWRIDFEFNSPINLDLNESEWLPNTETKFNWQD
jgi:hypothetical protein